MTYSFYSMSSSDNSNEIKVAFSLSSSEWTSRTKINSPITTSNITTTATLAQEFPIPQEIERGLLMRCALSEASLFSCSFHDEEIKECDCITQDLINAIDESMDVELFMHTMDYRMLMTRQYPEPSCSPHCQHTIVNPPQLQLQYQPDVLPQVYYESQYPTQIPQPQSQLLLQNHILQSHIAQPRIVPLHMFQPQMAQPQMIRQAQMMPLALSAFSEDSMDFNRSLDLQHMSFESEFRELCERIWRVNDQKASITMQDRIRAAIPGEYEVLVGIIHDQVETLMVHRFGNFLVQCMLETATLIDIEKFASGISGKVATLAKHQFCCHVLQKLLDVSPLLIQVRIASELLDDVYSTMTSTFGSHVWQKMLHLPWSEGLPSLAVLANNAIQLQLPEHGWVAIADTEAGCSTIRSYLCLGENDRLDCAQDLLDGVHHLMTGSTHTSALVCKLAMLSSTRSRTMALIFSRVNEYCQHPSGSEILINLLRLKIPSFPTRFNAAVTPYRSKLEINEYARFVLLALEQAQIGYSL